MIDSQELLDALKVREEHNKPLLKKINQWFSIATPVAGGVSTLYKVSSSAATISSHSMTNATQGGLSVIGSVLDLMTSFPNMIVIATSDRPWGEKVRDIVPQLVLTVLGVSASVLGVLALNAIGGLVLATAGAALGMATASVFLGFMGYHLLRAWVAKKAVDTVFEGKVGTIEGVFKFIKISIFNPKQLDAKVSEGYDFIGNQDHLKTLTLILKQQLAEKSLNPILKKLSDNQTLDVSELKLIDEIERTLSEWFDLHQTKVQHTKTSEDKRELTVENRHALANENLLASGVNFLLSAAGVLFVTIGLLTLIAPFIAAPPLLGVILGAIGLALASFGLVKFITELRFSWDEAKATEQLTTEILTQLITSSQKETTPMSKLMSNQQVNARPEREESLISQKQTHDTFIATSLSKEALTTLKEEPVISSTSPQIR